MFCSNLEIQQQRRGKQIRNLYTHSGSRDEEGWFGWERDSDEDLDADCDWSRVELSRTGGIRKGCVDEDGGMRRAIISTD